MALKKWQKMCGILCSAILMSTGNLCITASKVQGEILYVSVTVTFIAEIGKLLTCILVNTINPPTSLPHDDRSTRSLPSTATKPPHTRWQHTISKYWIGWKEALLYALPALLYTIDNNLAFVILKFMDPATLSILWNLKILTTAFLFRVVLKKKLTDLQHIALVLLVLGVITSQAKHTMGASMHSNKHELLQESSKNNTASHTASTSTANTSTSIDYTEHTKFAVGMLLVFIGITLSSMAGILTEYALKRNAQWSFFVQNAYFYVFGISFNFFGVLCNANKINANGFFYGYTYWTWLIIASHTFGGMLMGFILKYLDNIMCVYTHVLAMMIIMLASICFFDFQLSLEFVCGLGVCITSMYLYHLQSDHCNSSDKKSDSSRESKHSEQMTTSATSHCVELHGEREAISENINHANSHRQHQSRVILQQSVEQLHEDKEEIALEDVAHHHNESMKLVTLQKNKKIYQKLPDDVSANE